MLTATTCGNRATASQMAATRIPVTSPKFTIPTFQTTPEPPTNSASLVLSLWPIVKFMSIKILRQISALLRPAGIAEPKAKVISTAILEVFIVKLRESSSRAGGFPIGLKLLISFQQSEYS